MKFRVPASGGPQRREIRKPGEFSYSRDHSIAIGSFAGMSTYIASGTNTWFDLSDAHADMNTPE